MNTLSVNGVAYTIVKLLGHGKGGYSYLAQRDGQQFVLKQIHHEPCDYYQFGNKIASEHRDYARLQDAGILIPRMLDIDLEQERILKEYIPGPTIAELVAADSVTEDHFRQVRQMAALAQGQGLNIDYYPTNFVVWDGVLYYVDYECNAYDPRWDFENWGIHYWRTTSKNIE